MSLLAARGLDLPRVNWIVQYDLPSDPSTYIHRVLDGYAFLVMIRKMTFPSY